MTYGVQDYFDAMRMIFGGWVGYVFITSVLIILSFVLLVREK